VWTRPVFLVAATLDLPTEKKGPSFACMEQQSTKKVAAKVHDEISSFGLQLSLNLFYCGT
jgi:hypothetical protein